MKHETITTERRIELEQAEEFLRLLQAFGVDNWQGYDIAVEQWEMQHPGEEVPE